MPDPVIKNCTFLVVLLLICLPGCSRKNLIAEMDFSSVAAEPYDFLPSASLEQMVEKMMQSSPEYTTIASSRMVKTGEFIQLTFENHSADTVFLTPVPHRHPRGLMQGGKPVSKQPPVMGIVQEWEKEKFLATAMLLDYPVPEGEWQSFNPAPEFPPRFVPPGGSCRFKARFSRPGRYYLRMAIYPAQTDIWSAREHFLVWPEFDVR